MSVDSHFSNESIGVSSSPGMSGYASQATSYMPAAASGRSAQLTISIPGGGSTSGSSTVVRSSRIVELRPTSDHPRASNQAIDEASSSSTIPSTVWAPCAAAHSPRPLQERRADAAAAQLCGHECKRAYDPRLRMPAVDADPGPRVLALAAREQPDRVLRLTPPVDEVADAPARSGAHGVQHADEARQVVLGDLHELEHARTLAVCLLHARPGGVDSLESLRSKEESFCIR